MKNDLFSGRNLLLSGIVLLTIACGAEGLSGLFVPNIGNDWTSSRNSLFVITPQDTGVNRSTLEGNESTDSTFDNFHGSFENYDVQFTFEDGKDAGVTYKGQFVKNSQPLKMVVTGDKNNETLTITKNN